MVIPHGKSSSPQLLVRTTRVGNNSLDVIAFFHPPKKSGQPGSPGKSVKPRSQPREIWDSEALFRGSKNLFSVLQDACSCLPGPRSPLLSLRELLLSNEQEKKEVLSQDMQIFDVVIIGAG